MRETFFTGLSGLGAHVGELSLAIIQIGAVFAFLSFFWPCNRGHPWWRKRELATDLGYWFVVTLLNRYLRIGLLVLGAAALFGITDVAALVAYFGNGHGPLARLPLWGQAAFALLAGDLITYGMHRLFHRPRLWPFHAVHHAPENLEWISAARFHPVNLMLGAALADTAVLLAGVSPAALATLAGFNIWYSAFVHANLNWTLGPFKYVLAGPVFHRWHHTAAGRGGNKNFASTFSFIDLMFGTFYMPKGELPDAYGIEDKTFPPGIWAQFLYPLRRPYSSQATPTAPG